jgi:predicted dehydrogenase
MKQWNVGIIGAGLIAEFHAKALRDLDNARIKGFCDSGSGRAKKLVEEYGGEYFDNYSQMLESKDIDMVTIATPSGAHMEPAVEAAERGKHVLCEKPIEITLERVDRMIEAHEKAGTYLGCIFQNRFNEAMTPLRKAIEEGRFGKITCAGVFVPWFRGDEYYQDSWHGTWEMDGGGALMNQSIHMVDMLCDMMPEVVEVKSFAAPLGHDIETEDTAVAAVRFSNNALGLVYGTTASYPGQYKRFEISGTTGTAIYLENGFTVWSFAEETKADDDIRRKYPHQAAGGGVSDPGAIDYAGHTKNCAAFIEAIESGKPFALDGREGRKAVKLILDIYRDAGLRG